MSAAQTTTADVVAAYGAVRPRYEQLASEIEFVLARRIADRNIETASITSRAKTVESVRQKVSRKQYDDPMAEVHDFAGVRVVCLYESDLPEIQRLIEGAFEVMDVADKTEALGSDHMGYQARHFIVRLGPQFRGDRYEGLQNLRCEIQARTVLQDAWAQISHHLVYKTDAAVPASLKRKLNNVMSLLEIAQQTFDEVRSSRRAYVEQVTEMRGDSTAFLSQPIDHETLRSYTEWRYPGLPVNPRLQDMLIADLNKDRYRTLADIHRAVSAATAAVDRYRAENPDWFRHGTDFITKSLGFFDEEFCRRHRFARRTREAFARYGNLVNRA